MNNWRTVLLDRATSHPDRLAYTFLSNGEDESGKFTYADVARRSAAVGATLRDAAAPGERAILLYAPGLEFIEAFYGCLLSKVVAVPVYPPDPTRLERSLQRLGAIVDDAKPSLVLTTSAIQAMAQAMLPADSPLMVMRWVATDQAESFGADATSFVEAAGNDLAFLQYTSGSTASPKGVMVSHGNLLHNCGLIRDACGLSGASVGVSWLPVYHDMGLIGKILTPLFVGGHQVLMSPLDFLRRPMRWLEAITTYRADISAAPNFAYDLCVRKSSDADIDTLDLHSWRVALNGAEPVRAETIDRFAERFEPAGFSRSSLIPCYGLAEATLCVSGFRRHREGLLAGFEPKAMTTGRIVPTASTGARRLVGCGGWSEDQTVLIVDPDSRAPTASGNVGEIWVAGDSVAQGYWSRADETVATFQARLAEDDGRRFLRTGDLGFIHDDELFITGRLKDLIVVRGRNHYPQDIERTAETAHAAIRLGCTAAFGVVDDDEEGVILVVELERRSGTDRRDRDTGRPPTGGGDRRADGRRHAEVLPVLPHGRAEIPELDSILEAVASSVTQEHLVPVRAVIGIRSGTIPKTSSGKIQRHACRAAFQSDELQVLARFELRPARPADTRVIDRSQLLTATVRPPNLDVPGLTLQARADLIARYLRECVQAQVRMYVDDDRPLTASGIDSLSAVEMRSRAEHDLRMSIPESLLLSGLSIRAIATELASRGRGSNPPPLLSDLPPAPHSSMPPPDNDHPLSHNQQGLWFIQQIEPENTAYNTFLAIDLEPRVQLHVLRRACEHMTRRHSALRTVFLATLDGPRQRVREDQIVTLRHVAVEDESQLDSHLEEETHQPFNLEVGPLCRFAVFELPQGSRRLLCVTVHHLVVDQWSLAVLLREIEEAYDAFAAGRLPNPPRRAKSYYDFIKWQNRHIDRPAGQADLRYWRTQLQDPLPTIELYLDHPRPRHRKTASKTVVRKLEQSVVAGVRRLALDTQATSFAILLSAFYAVLRRRTHQDDLIIGVPTTTRGRAEFAHTVGYFINPLPVRVRARGDQSFRELIAQTRGQLLDAMDHRNLPFSLIVERLAIARDPQRHPVFDVMFAMSRPSDLVNSNLARDILDSGQAGTLLDLTLQATEHEDGLVLRLEYNGHLFEEESAERILGHYATVLHGMIHSPDAILSHAATLEASELALVCHGFNETRRNHSEQFVHETIARRCAASPSALAVVAFDPDGTERKTTYGELDASANRIARTLLARGLQPEATVGIYMGRGPDLIATMLGVLKAGCAYLPLDPGFPTDRLAFIRSDADARCILADRALPEALLASGVEVINLGADRAAIDAQSRNPPRIPTRADQLAYVIYTSGSTGQPKGVQITHRALTNFLASMQRTPGIEQADILLAATTVSFDIAGLELFLPLIAGARVVVVSPDDAADGRRLAERISEYRATILQATPAAFRMLLASDWGGNGSRPLEFPRKILVGGEALPPDLAEALTSRCEELHNMYGPTETTIWSTTGRVSGSPTSVTIGSPIDNTRIYILDVDLEPCPIGVEGELFIAGDGLARGYRGRSDLTADRFLPDPIADEPGARMYRTGDLATWKSDGRITIAGRNDQQVKLRGYRIELGEIEATLRKLDAVTDCAVALWGEGHDAQLVAYLIGDEEIDTTAVRRALRTFLPDYMIPAVFTQLARLPLTPNGKFDRKALPAPARPLAEHHGVAPRTSLERALVAIWCEVLDIDGIGVTDDFFAIGGHSLLAMQIATRVHAYYGATVELRALFADPTIAGLAEHVEAVVGDPEQVERVSRVIVEVSEMGADTVREMLDGD